MLRYPDSQEIVANKFCLELSNLDRKNLSNARGRAAKSALLI